MDSRLSRRVLKRGNVDSVQTLQGKIVNYIQFYHQTPMPIKWKGEKIMEKLKK